MFNIIKINTNRIYFNFQIIEVRDTIKKQKSLEKIKQHRPDEFSRFCSDESISRYLRARNWNVKKAVKMLESSLIWRMNYKPEEIRWVSFHKK